MPFLTYQLSHRLTAIFYLEHAEFRPFKKLLRQVNILSLYVFFASLEILKEVIRKEEEAGIIPDPDIDMFMKVEAEFQTSFKHKKYFNSNKS